MIVSAIALGLVTLISSLLLLIGYADPEGAIARALPIADFANERATRALLVARPDAAALAEAEAETRRVLRLSPYDSTAWARLAYIQSLRHPPIDAEGLKDLRQSYVVAPLGPDISRWRVRFALEHWKVMPPDLQAQVRAELAPLWWRDQAYVEGLSQQVVDPAGRLAIALEILLLRARETQARARAAHH